MDEIYRWWMLLAAVRVEEPASNYSHLGAVGGHDALVQDDLGSGDEPAGFCRVG